MATPVTACRVQALVPAAAAVALSLALCARGLAAQEIPPWTLGVHAGRSEIHGRDEGGRIALIGINRVLERRGVARLGGEVGLSLGHDGFALGRAVAELQLLPANVLCPFISGSIGLIGEGDYFGSAVSVGGGLIVHSSQNLGLRAEVSRGSHDGLSGPHLFLLGLDFHFRKKTVAPDRA